MDTAAVYYYPISRGALKAYDFAIVYPGVTPLLAAFTACFENQTWIHAMSQAPPLILLYPTVGIDEAVVVMG